MTTVEGSLFQGRVGVPSGIPGIDLVHLLEFTPSDGLPLDGVWSVTLADKDAAMQRCHFRTIHAAAHYALRIANMADWSLGHDAITAELTGERGGELQTAMRHAEAHAHEVDAAYPVGTWIAMEGGPSILDDDGATRQYMRGQPSIEWIKDQDNQHVCKVCGAAPKVVYGWMDR